LNIPPAHQTQTAPAIAPPSPNTASPAPVCPNPAPRTQPYPLAKIPMSEMSKPTTPNTSAPVPPAGTPAPATSSSTQQPTPLRCVLGAVVAGALAFGLYRMTTAIALSFAAHPVESPNLIVQRISAAVRTLVIGMTTMGTGVFGLAALGLLALAVQLLLRRAPSPESSD